MVRQKLAIFLTLAVLLAPLSSDAAELAVLVRDSDGNPVQDAVVFVQSQSGTTLNQIERMVQRNESFNPFVLPVAIGTTVEFPNEDPFRHHVYSFSPAKQFELKLYGGDELQQVKFETPGVVALGCNIHDNMLGYIYVVDSHVFGKTNEDGAVTISGLQDGEVGEAQVWHPRLRGPARRTATTVTAGQSVTFEIADDDLIADDPNNESGNAWTAAYVLRPFEKQRLTLELLHVQSNRPARVGLGVPSHANETVLQASYRFFL